MPRQFQREQEVWMRTRHETIVNKGETTRVEIIQEGPFVIVKAVSQDSYLLKYPDSNILGVVPGSRLRSFDQTMQDNDATWSTKEKDEASLSMLYTDDETGCDDEGYYEYYDYPIQKLDIPVSEMWWVDKYAEEYETDDKDGGEVWNGEEEEIYYEENEVEYYEADQENYYYRTEDNYDTENKYEKEENDYYDNYENCYQNNGEENSAQEYYERYPQEEEDYGYDNNEDYYYSDDEERSTREDYNWYPEDKDKTYITRGVDEEINDYDYEENRYKENEKYKIREEKINSMDPEVQDEDPYKQKTGRNGEQIPLTGRRITDLCKIITQKVELMEEKLGRPTEDTETKEDKMCEKTICQEDDNEKENKFPLNEEAIHFINMLRLGRTYNTKNYQSEFKTMINIYDDEIAYMPELYTQEEYDHPKSESETENEHQINVIHAGEDTGEDSEITSLDEREIGQIPTEKTTSEKTPEEKSNELTNVKVTKNIRIYKNFNKVTTISGINHYRHCKVRPMTTEGTILNERQSDKPHRNSWRDRWSNHWKKNKDKRRISENYRIRYYENESWIGPREKKFLPKINVKQNLGTSDNTNLNKTSNFYVRKEYNKDKWAKQSLDQEEHDVQKEDSKIYYTMSEIKKVRKPGTCGNLTSGLEQDTKDKRMTNEIQDPNKRYVGIEDGGQYVNKEKCQKENMLHSENPKNEEEKNQENLHHLKTYEFASDHNMEDPKQNKHNAEIEEEEATHRQEESINSDRDDQMNDIADVGEKPTTTDNDETKNEHVKTQNYYENDAEGEQQPEQQIKINKDTQERNKRSWLKGTLGLLDSIGNLQALIDRKI